MSLSDKPSADGAVFNEAEALARTGDDRELFRELVEMVLADLPNSLRELKVALSQQDRGKLHRLAHNLKGHLAAVGSGPVVEAIRELDAHARAGNLEGARSAHDALLKQVDRLRPELQDWLRANKPR
jgi:HPt (histidine-containing phosphotransfer) domain-containing protein